MFSLQQAERRSQRKCQSLPVHENTSRTSATKDFGPQAEICLIKC